SCQILYTGGSTRNCCGVGSRCSQCRRRCQRYLASRRTNCCPNQSTSSVFKLICCAGYRRCIDCFTKVCNDCCACAYTCCATCGNDRRHSWWRIINSSSCKTPAKIICQRISCKVL